MEKVSKIIITFILVLAVFLLIKSTGFYYNDYSNNALSIQTGDANMDGIINSPDYVLISKFIMRTTTLSNAQMKIADMNNDNNVTSLDYILIRKKIMSGDVKPTATAEPTITPVPTVEPTITPTPVPTSKTYVITEDSKYASYANIAACNSDTMKYRIITDHGNNIVLVWVADSASQMKLGLANPTAVGATKAENILSKEVPNGKCMVATNSSFFTAGSVDSNAIIHNGIAIRDKGKAGGIIGINSSGYLKEYSYKTASELLQDGVVNTYVISSPTHIDKGQALANRTQVCQIDKNNFALLSGSGKVYTCGEQLKSLTGCKTAYNLDGGGSRKLFYQTKTMALTRQFGGGREVPDMLYFTEK